MTRMGQTTSAPTETAADRAVVRRLVLGSALMLFLELALIRWLGSNIVHLSYFSNFVLLGSFLGIGVGFLVSRRSWTLIPAAPVLLALLVVGVRQLPVSLDRTGSDVIYFTSLQATGPPAWLVLPAVFVVVALVLAGPAEIVGRCFADLTPLTAYRWDLVGSLVGIGGFTVLSFLWAPPVVWGVIVALAFVLLVPNLKRVLSIAAGAVVVGVLLVESTAAGTSWSPYYKVTTKDVVPGNPDFVDISVNGVPHQLMAPAQWKLEQGEQQYSTPYLRIKDNSLDDVLIVGAGSGSDVAIALSKGATHVDAVDIDPRIMQIGVERNPDRAYQSPRVTRHVNDGRAFLTGTDKKYDLILFALPDSLTLVSGASQIRLESFLFTDRAIEEARDHLKPDGAFAMYNYYRELWLIDRLAGTASEVFGHTPVRRHVRRRPGRGDGGPRPRVPAVRDDVPALGRGHRRRPPTTGRSCTSRARASRASTSGRSAASCSSRWSRCGLLGGHVPVDAAVRRPVLHGRRVPAAGDQERRDVRDAVRHHVAGERAGVRRRARDRAGRRRDDETGAHATAAGGLRRHRGVAGGGVRRAARLAAAVAVRAPAAAWRCCSRSCRSTWPTSPSPSGSARRATRGRRSRSTSWARSSAAAWSTPRC